MDCTFNESSTTEELISESDLASRWGLPIETLQAWRSKEPCPVIFYDESGQIGYSLYDVKEFEARIVRCAVRERINQGAPKI